MSSRQKVVNKSKVWWRHGKHKGRLVGVLLLGGVSGRRSRELEELDLSGPDWSSRRSRG